MNLLSLLVINSAIIVVLSLSNTDNNLNSKEIPPPVSVSYEIKAVDEKNQKLNQLNHEADTKVISKTLTFDKTDEPEELKSTKIITGSNKNHRFIFPKYSKEFTNFYKTIFKNNNELQIGCEEGFTSQQSTSTTMNQNKSTLLQRKQRDLPRNFPQYKEPNRYILMSPIFFVVQAKPQSSRRAVQNRFLTAEQLTQECSETPCYIYANPKLKSTNQPQYMFQEIPSRKYLPPDITEDNESQRKFQPSNLEDTSNNIPKYLPTDNVADNENNRIKYRDEIACLEGDITKCSGRKLKPKFRIPEDLECPENDISKCAGRKRKSSTTTPASLGKRKPTGRKIQIEDLPCSEDDISKCTGRRKNNIPREQIKFRFDNLPCNEEDISKCKGRKLNNNILTTSNPREDTVPPTDDEFLDTVPPIDSTRDVDDYDSQIPEKCTEDDVTKCVPKISKLCNEDAIEKCPGYSTTLKENLKDLEKPVPTENTKTFQFPIEHGDKKDKPTDCLWAIITCCTYNTDHLRKGCLHVMNCPQSKWSKHEPCSEEFAKISYDSSNLFYDN